jgi:hypothetical protein
MLASPNSARSAKKVLFIPLNRFTNLKGVVPMADYPAGLEQ